MLFSKIQPNVLARYEPFGNDIYLLVNNQFRIVKHDSDSYNALKNMINLTSWDNEFFSIPKNVQIQITKACNFRCSFCYANAVNSGKPEFYMPKEKLFFIADKLYNSGVINIQYVGGETFMHKDFPEVIEYVEELGLSQTLITNGIIPGLKIEKYKYILSSFNKIQISINAAQNRYDDVVGLKMYEKMLVALENIANINSSVWISFVVTATNLEDIRTVVGLANKSGCAGVRFGILAKHGRGSDEELSYFHCLNEASILLKSAQDEYPNVKIECHFNPTLNNSSSETIHYSEGISMLFINLDGDIFPFPLLENKEMNMGNIFKDDLSDLWMHSEILEQFRSPSAISSECQKCLTPCTLRSPCISYLWKGKVGEKVPCYLYDFEK